MQLIWLRNKYSDYVLSLEGFLDDENVSDEEETEAVANVPKYLNLTSNEDRDNVYNDNEYNESCDTTPTSDKSIKNMKKGAPKAPQPDEDTSKWDYFAYLTDKYGYDNFKRGLEIVKKNNMIRFKDGGETQIKQELAELLGLKGKYLFLLLKSTFCFVLLIKIKK